MLCGSVVKFLGKIFTTEAQRLHRDSQRRLVLSIPRRKLVHLVLCGVVALQPFTTVAQRPRQASVTVTVSPGHPANRFIPSRALGAGVDGHAEGETDRQLSR